MEHHGNCRCVAHRNKVPAPPLVPLIRRASKGLDGEAPTGNSSKWSPYEKSQHRAGGVKALGLLYSDRFGGLPSGATRTLQRILAGQKTTDLDTADKVCILAGTSLEAVYGPYEEAS